MTDKAIKVEVIAKSHHAYVDGKLENFKAGEQEIPADIANHMISLGKALLPAADVVKEISKAKSADEIESHAADGREIVAEAYKKKLESFKK